jgi:hypothetical protein
VAYVDADLPPTVFRALRRFATRKRLPRLRSLSPGHSGTWSSLDLAPFTSRLELTEEEVTLYLTSRDPDDSEALLRQFGVRNSGLELVLADGSRFTAELANFKKLGREGIVSIHHWRWTSASGVPPVLWVGQADLGCQTRHNSTLGSTSLRGTRREILPLYLRGLHEWFVFERGSTSWCAVPAPSMVDAQQLRDDLLCLEFALGGPVELKVLYGLDATLKVVSAIHLGRSSRTQSGGGRCPVLDDHFAWQPELFQKVAATVRNEGIAKVLRGTANYVDATSTHIDAAYLLAQVGLESVVRALASEGDLEPVARDLEQWHGWVDSLRPAAEGRLVDKDDWSGVRAALRYSGEASAMRVLSRFLGRHGVVLPREVKDEIRKRNVAAHSYFTVPDLQYDVDRESRRQEIILTVLAAVVAVHVGYSGPLTGYDVNARGERPSPSWWPARVAADRPAVIRFRCGARSSSRRENAAG